MKILNQKIMQRIFLVIDSDLNDKRINEIKSIEQVCI